MYDMPHSAGQTDATPSGDIASTSEFPAANRYPQAGASLEHMQVVEEMRRTRRETKDVNNLDSN